MVNYNTQIKQYQEVSINNLQSQLIKRVIEKVTGIELSIEQLVYITCIFNVRNNRKRNEKSIEQIQVPVQYLFSLITPFPSTDYYKSVFQEYMASITQSCIAPLNSLVKCSGYTKDHCRKFTIDPTLIDAMDNEIEDVLESNIPLEVIKYNTTLGVKPAKWGGYCLKVQHLPSLTKTVWYKLKES